MANYGISAGSKLSYATITGGVPGTYNDLVGITEIPDLGSTPELIDTTTLDNAKYMSYTQGLIDLGTLDFPFNLEHPSATANINVIAGLSDTTEYSWKITYASGVTVVFTSKPCYTFNAVGVNALESFTLHLAPTNGLTITVPTASV